MYAFSGIASNRFSVRPFTLAHITRPCSVRTSSRSFSCWIPDGVRTGASTERTRGSSRHSSRTPLPIMPVAPKMMTFTALRARS